MRKATIKETTVKIPTYRLAEPEKSPLFIEKRAYQGTRAKYIHSLLQKKFMMKRKTRNIQL